MDSPKIIKGLDYKSYYKDWNKRHRKYKREWMRAWRQDHMVMNKHSCYFCRTIVWGRAAACKDCFRLIRGEYITLNEDYKLWEYNQRLSPLSPVLETKPVKV